MLLPWKPEFWMKSSITRQSSISLVMTLVAIWVPVGLWTFHSPTQKSSSS
jgi:hypothetical protein